MLAKGRMLHLGVASHAEFERGGKNVLFTSSFTLSKGSIRKAQTNGMNQY